MRVKALKNMALVTALALMTPAIAHANNINEQALKLAEQAHFDAALSVLAQQDTNLQTGYDHRFLKSRILSWAGQYSAARAELNSLMLDYPDNPDLQLTLGNLEYYQGRLDAAQTQYEQVLVKHPDYQDARNGLENVKNAKSEAAQNSQGRWRIDGAAGLSDFDKDDIDGWDDQFLRVEYRPDTLSYHASAQRFKRFGLEDVEIKAGISDAVQGGWDWGFEAGITPNASFRPELSFGFRAGRAIEIENGTVLYPIVTYRFDDYEAGAIHNFQPGLTTYLVNGVVLSGRLITTFQDDEDDLLGWLVEGRVPVTERLELRAGYADAPEAIDGLAISTKTFFGGLTYNLRDDLDIHINVARDDRENSFVRNSTNVGFTYKR